MMCTTRLELKFISSSLFQVSTKCFPWFYNKNVSLRLLEMCLLKVSC